MSFLFAEMSQGPPGFTYTPDFLTMAEETELIRHIKNLELQSFRFQGFEAKRKVASFGVDYSFDTRAVKKGNPIPKAFHPLISKVAAQVGIQASALAEVLITEYPIGSVINWHRDAPPFGVITGISLASDCIFKFRPHDEINRGRRSVISLPVARRSLYVIKDAARSAWQHSTAPVRDVRYSITLRTLLSRNDRD